MTIATASERSEKVAALTPHDIPVEVRLRRLAQLDLAHIKRKLIKPAPQGKGLSQEQADHAELWYRRFLEVIVRHPELNDHVPSLAIDTFWHEHILDTQKYAEDCEHVLGYFLHHAPYYGDGDDAEQEAMARAFTETNALYRRYFGEDCMSTSTDQAADCYRICEAKCGGFVCR